MTCFGEKICNVIVRNDLCQDGFQNGAGFFRSACMLNAERDSCLKHISNGAVEMGNTKDQSGKEGQV